MASAGKSGARGGREMSETELLPLQVVENDSGDQEARDEKESIERRDKAAANVTGKAVVPTTAKMAARRKPSISGR